MGTRPPTTGADEGKIWSTAFLVPHEPAGAAEAGNRVFVANEHGELIVAELSRRQLAVHHRRRTR